MILALILISFYFASLICCEKLQICSFSLLVLIASVFFIVIFSAISNGTEAVIKVRIICYEA
ncbi:hypothetical protein [Spiroplasma sp. Moj]|uniref:hypothetical protein n=1 Tax=Spiroplasma sp. Moj TaxID=1922342 RepID=UPI0039EE6948|nr:hypothetical protein [Spiroplasma sp. Moj]